MGSVRTCLFDLLNRFQSPITYKNNEEWTLDSLIKGWIYIVLYIDPLIKISNMFVN